jgi:hypothetical protein
MHLVYSKTRATNGTMAVPMSMVMVLMQLNDCRRRRVPAFASCTQPVLTPIGWHCNLITTYGSVHQQGIEGLLHHPSLDGNCCQYVLHFQLPLVQARIGVCTGVVNGWRH